MIGYNTRRPPSKGQSIIEFTLFLPILLILLGGILDLGLILFVSHTTKNATREGARFAVTLPDLTANDPRVIAAVDSRLPNISLFADFKQHISNTAPTGTACDLKVTISTTGSYPFVILRLIGLDHLTLSPDTTMRYELCQ